MHKQILAAILGLTSLTAFATARAQDMSAPYSPPSPPVHFTLDAGLTGGGDKLATVTFTDGSTQSIYAGNSIYADLGFMARLGASPWTLKGTLGYAYTGVTASNANVNFTYYPLDVLAIYNYGNHHFGAGLTAHMSPRLDMDGFAPNVDFDTAGGIILEYRYWLFGVRYTNIRYKVSGGGGSADGSSLGLFFNYTF